MDRVMGVIIGIAFVLALSQAAAALEWTLRKKEGRAFLQGHSGEPETDIEFWAHCRPDKAIEIGAGAEPNVGKGRGEAVTLTLSSAGKAATLTGVSRKSANFQMTAATELRTRVSREHSLFAVFATGRPIVVEGAAKPVTWQTKDLKARAAAFLQGCR